MRKILGEVDRFDQEKLRRGATNEVKFYGKMAQKAFKLGNIEMDCSISIRHYETVIGYFDNVCQNWDVA